MWKIVQYCATLDMNTGEPMCPEQHGIVIRCFNTYLGAFLYWWWHYDFGADQAWKGVFRWEIQDTKEGTTHENSKGIC